MGAEEFRTEQSYFLERRRLINRTVHGWGVVAGLKIEACGNDGATVGEGLAFDRRGRELLLCKSVALSECNTWLSDKEQPGCFRSLREATPGRYLLCAHYAERPFGDAPDTSHCGCGPVEKNFVRETVVFSVTYLGDCPCPHAESDCPHCACGTEACCDHDHGPHACLCQWIEDRAVSCTAKPLCNWKHYRVDPKDGVPLACVQLTKSDDPCEPIRVCKVDDACRPRRLVKNNDLLYDLIRGCGLTRISWISWGRYHRQKEEMPWDEFMQLIGPAPNEKNPHPRTGISVRFSGPVCVNTLMPDCFALYFIFSHPDTGWHEKREVLVTHVWPEPPEPGDPDGTTRQVTLSVRRSWLREIHNRPNKFGQEGAIVQIEIRGDYILDCHGRPIDANANGFALFDAGDGQPPRPSGNGTRGGVFLSVFRVPRRPHHRYHADADDDRTEP